ncbi:MAG: hypothetical protein JHC74_12975 [Thermoleophilia bacterium]|nr:hypothetical protein [Thermoleophilia bacterium]
MSTGTGHIDVAPVRRWGAGHTAVALGVVAVVLSFIAWEWFTWGGVVLGVPVGIAALATGMRARRESGSSRILGTLGIALAAVVVLIPLAYMTASAVS